MLPGLQTMWSVRWVSSLNTLLDLYRLPFLDAFMVFAKVSSFFNERESLFKDRLQG